MQLDSIIASLLNGYTRLGSAERAARRGVLAGDQSSGNPFSRQGNGGGLVTISAPEVPSPTVLSPQLFSPSNQVDKAEISAPARAANLLNDGSNSDSTATTPNAGALVESFIRKRAILAYRSPQKAGQGNFDFTLDVEVAYRVLQFVPAQGGTVDVKA